MASNPAPPSGNWTSGQKLEGVAAPYVARLFNQHGPVNRRKILQVASGGIVGTILGGGSVNAEGFFSRLLGSSDAAVAGPAEQIDGPTSHFMELGDYLWLTPTKLGGGAQVQDLATGKTLAWIEYWNYGDSCPIAHHLAAFPSAGPAQRLRIRQLDAGRPKRADLRHTNRDQGTRHARPDLGPRQPDLSRRLRRSADESLGKYCGDDGNRRRRSHGHFPRCFGLFRLGWTERCRGVFHKSYRTRRRRRS